MVAAQLVDADGCPDSAAARAIQVAAVDEGLLLLTCGAFGHVIRFIPPLIVGKEHIDEGVEKFAGALARA